MAFAQAGSKESGAAVARLARRWQDEQDAAAREQLFELFQPLAKRLASRYARSSVPREDLLQVAYVGLLLAIDRFDPDRGAFSSLAIPTILGELRRHFRDRTWTVHVTRGAQERSLAVREARDHLTSEQGRAPTVQQIAQYMEVDQEVVLDGMQALNAYETAPLDAPLKREDDAGGTVLDLFGEQDPGFEKVERKTDLALAVRDLPEREQAILKMRFREELSQSEIGDRIGCSQMQVSRLLTTILTQLREEMSPR